MDIKDFQRIANHSVQRFCKGMREQHREDAHALIVERLFLKSLDGGIDGEGHAFGIARKTAIEFKTRGLGRHKTFSEAEIVDVEDGKLWPTSVLDSRCKPVFDTYETDSELIHS